jgi:RNA polymerase sigma-70 factor (ECF subfamily)
MMKGLLPFRRGGLDRQSDEDLVRECAGGDNTALAELFRRHGDRVYRILRRLGHVEPRDLEDMVQATFVAVKRAAGRFGARSAVSTWIIGIALKVARHHERGRDRHRVAMAAVAESQESSDGRDPEQQASQRQLLGRLHAALEELPPDLRTVFALCDLEGLRGVDVAQVLAVPQGTVWRRLHEARTRLRRSVEGDAKGR